MSYKMKPGDEPMGRTCETEGRGYVKADQELGFFPSPPNYGRWHSRQEGECQVNKAEDLGWANSGRAQSSEASLDCFHALGAVQIRIEAQVMIARM